MIWNRHFADIHSDMHLKDYPFPSQHFPVKFANSGVNHGFCRKENCYFKKKLQMQDINLLCHKLNVDQCIVVTEMV